MIALKDQVAIVTGGSRGIGKSIVVELAKAGASICFTNRNEELAKVLEDQIRDLGAECFSFQGDISSSDHCSEVIREVKNKFARIDILVNNAGITEDNLMMRMKDQAWQNVLNTNLSGVFYITKAATKLMMKARYGRIINITSVVGHTGNPGQVNYSASKAGLIGFTKSVAKELGSRNITCNAIAPGFIQTNMTEELNETEHEILIKNIPLGRMGEPKEIANAVLFLVSKLADYITGTTLHINGGMY